MNIDFNHDVNYEGLFHLEESLKEGRPAGLSHFGAWPTLYEALSSFPEQVQKSWLNFDHYYSDQSFECALEEVFALHPHKIMDVGGNTGRFAQLCVARDKQVEVTVVDLPQQIGLMKKAIANDPEANRIHGLEMDLLNPENAFPQNAQPDVIWMSQFLDCFSEEQILSILLRAVKVMSPHARLFIMETLWDRQKYETAAFCLTMTSVYFAAIANGNSKMYHSEDLLRLVNAAGLQVEQIHDNLGLGHSILVCKI